MSLFESVPAQPASRITVGSYAQALYGLHHDRGVAENIFAARAKVDFINILGIVPKRLELAEKHTDVSPLWVAQQAIALRLKDLPSSPRDEAFDEAARPLKELVTSLAHSVLDSFKGMTEGQVLVLVGALAVRVQDIGGGRFSFSLKQKWGFDDG